jgi:protein-L-isoaspartate O-methyltransferase
MITETTLYSFDTPFNHYEVVNMDYDNRPSRILFSGDRSAAQSGIALDKNPAILFDYNQRFIEIALELKAIRILVIGGGALTLPSALVAESKSVIIDVVELDPDLEAIAEQYFGYVASKQIKVHVTDGYKYLITSAARYDLIIIDAFSNTTMPASLRSKKAIQAYARHVRPGGAVCMNVISSYYGKNAEVLTALHSRYSAVFATTTMYPASRSLLSYWLPQNFILLAQSLPTRTVVLPVPSLPLPPGQMPLTAGV